MFSRHPANRKFHSGVSGPALCRTKGREPEPYGLDKLWSKTFLPYRRQSAQWLVTDRSRSLRTGSMYCWLHSPDLGLYRQKKVGSLPMAVGAIRFDLFEPRVPIPHGSGRLRSIHCDCLRAAIERIQHARNVGYVAKTTCEKSKSWDPSRGDAALTENG